VLLAIALAHAALLAWLNLQVPHAKPVGEGPGVIVGLFGPAALGAEAALSSVAVEVITSEVVELAAAETVEVEPPIVPPEMDPFYLESPSDVRLDTDPVEVGPSTTAALASASATAGGGDADACRLAERIQSALASDPAFRSAVSNIAPEKRSVANAVMLWNGQWMELGGRETAPIRSALTRFVREASPACRQEPVTGPLFLYVEGRPRTTVLAVGSGVWRWADLLAEDGARSTLR
jgi:hypothetical protein